MSLSRFLYCRWALVYLHTAAGASRLRRGRQVCGRRWAGTLGGQRRSQRRGGQLSNQEGGGAARCVEGGRGAHWKSEPMVSMMSGPRVALAIRRHCSTNASTLQREGAAEVAVLQQSDTARHWQAPPHFPFAPLLHVVLIQARVVHDGRAGPLKGKALWGPVVAWRCSWRVQCERLAPAQPLNPLWPSPLNAPILRNAPLMKLLVKTEASSREAEPRHSNSMAVRLRRCSMSC